MIRLNTGVGFMERSHDIMKYCLADALKRCMKQAPLEKITVSGIVEE